MGSLIIGTLLCFSFSGTADEVPSPKPPPQPTIGERAPSSYKHTNSIFVLDPKSAVREPATQNSNSKSGIYASIGILGQKASASSDNEARVQNRNFYVLGVDSILGYQIGSVILGFGGSYSFWSQQTNPADIADSNLQGTQISGGLVLGYDFDFMELLAQKNLTNVFQVQNKNLGEEEIKYLDGESYAVQLRFKFIPSIYVGLKFTSDRYKFYSAGDKKRDLLKDDELKLQAYGINLGVKF